MFQKRGTVLSISSSNKTFVRVVAWLPWIGMLLALGLLIAVALRWSSEQARFERELAEAELEIDIQSRQIKYFKQLPPRISGDVGKPEMTATQFKRTWTTETFLEGAREFENKKVVQQLGRQLSCADDDEFHPIMKELIPLMADEQMQVRRNAMLIADKQFTAFTMERAKSYREPLSENLLAVLKRDAANQEQVSLALELLRDLGANTYPGAVEVVTAIMEQDDHLLALDAALVAKTMDDSMDIGPRLIDLIEGRHHDWASAAMHLQHHVPPKQAYAFLRSQFVASNNDSDRDEIARVMSFISLEE